MQYLYSIFDSVSCEFSNPVLLKNDDVAKRWFKTQALKGVDPSCVADLRLYYIGEFCLETGVVSDNEPEDITDSADSPEVTKEIMEAN